MAMRIENFGGTPSPCPESFPELARWYQEVSRENIRLAFDGLTRLKPGR
jgi:hypothetical protein